MLRLLWFEFIRLIAVLVALLPGISAALERDDLLCFDYFRNSLTHPANMPGKLLVRMSMSTASPATEALERFVIQTLNVSDPETEKEKGEWVQIKLLGLKWQAEAKKGGSTARRSASTELSDAISLRMAIQGDFGGATLQSAAHALDRLHRKGYAAVAVFESRLATSVANYGIRNIPDAYLSNDLMSGLPYPDPVPYGPKRKKISLDAMSYWMRHPDCASHRYALERLVGVGEEWASSAYPTNKKIPEELVRAFRDYLNPKLVPNGQRDPFYSKRIRAIFKGCGVADPLKITDFEPRSSR